MVSKTKTKTRKKGKQTREAKRAKASKKSGAKKPSTRLAASKRLSARRKRSSSSRSRIASVPVQANEIAAREGPPSTMSTADTIVSAEAQGEVEPSEPMEEEATSYERPVTDENTEDYNDLATSDIE